MIHNKSTVIANVLVLLATLLSTFFVHAYSLGSPNGKYSANVVGSGNDMHFAIRERATGRLIFRTQAQYDTPNDVKAGAFSADSQYFAAAYHYGHKGDYTWVGVWQLSSGRLVHSETASGFLRDVSWVFPRIRSTNACLDEVRSCMINCDRIGSDRSYSSTTRRRFKKCKEDCDFGYYTCTRQNP